MTYNYQTERPKLFDDAGQRVFLKTRDRVRFLITQAGAFRYQEFMNDAGFCGDSWLLLATIDRLVELGELERLTPAAALAQHAVFIRGKSWPM
jgi:hypothetical protein